MGLRLEGIDKTVGRDIHLQGVDIDFAPGSRNIILGRTLAGKTSLLRIMAGLDRPTRGRVLVDDQDVTGRSVRRRSVAMVYQQFINYPSQTIFENIASPLRIAGAPKDEIEAKVHQTAAMLRIDHLLDRLPAELSGGQQQRTAIARALIKDVHLLLLDEPLVNLDYKLREELREELQNIFEQRESIVVYTTTEPTEALMLGGDIVVMDKGRVLQTGPTPHVYHHPASTKVAEVFSDPPINFIKGRIQAGEARMGDGLVMRMTDGHGGLEDGDYTFGIRASRLFLDPRHDNDVPIKGEVALAEINGSETFIHLSHGGRNLVVQEDGVRTFKVGSPLTVYVDPCDFHVFHPDGRLLVSPTAGCKP